MNDLEAVIGGKEWKVGDVIRWTAPNGQKYMRTIVKFMVNSQTNETMAVMDNSVCFGAGDVENGWVEVSRYGSHSEG